MKAFHGRALGAALIAEGICPPNARSIELQIPADGAVFIRYETIVDDADLAKVARALTTILASAEGPRS